MEDRVRIRYVPLDETVADYVSALFVLQAGSQGIDEPLQPDWGVVGFALTGSWTWSRGGSADEDDRLTFGTLFGPMDRAVRMTATPNSRTVGMTLTPLGWAQLVGIPASELVGRAVPVSSLFDEAAELLENLAAAPTDDILTARLVKWLTRRIRLAPTPDPHIRLISSVLDEQGLRTIDDLAARTGLPAGMLTRLCPVIFGFSPDALLERQRFLRTLRDLQIQSMTGDVRGFRGDYADEEAFETAFRSVMGQSVADYLASARTMLKAGLRAAGLVGHAMPDGVIATG